MRGEPRRDALGYQDEVLVKRFKLGESLSLPLAPNLESDNDPFCVPFHRG